MCAQTGKTNWHRCKRARSSVAIVFNGAHCTPHKMHSYTDVHTDKLNFVGFFFRAVINFFIAVGPFRLYAIIIILSAFFAVCMLKIYAEFKANVIWASMCLLNWHSFASPSLSLWNLCVIATVLQINRYLQQRLNNTDYLLMKSRHCHKIS